MSVNREDAGLLPEATSAESLSGIFHDCMGSSNEQQSGFLIVGVNQEALSSWVAQEGAPCCAAAVVAAAVNYCGSGQHQGTIGKALESLLAVVESRIVRLMERANVLGAPGDIRRFLEDRLDSEIPGWNSCKNNQKAINRIVAEVASEVQRHPTELEDPSKQAFGDSTRSEMPISFDIPFGGVNDLSQVLLAMVGKINCARKLQRDKPSTAGVGNWAIKAALEAEGFRVERVLGKTGLGRCPPFIRATDEGAWDAFKVEFSKYDCMIVHFKNHYALVFAFRERGGNLKQILTARKGQRPKDWVHWEEIIRSVIRWRGYGMLGINRKKRCDGVIDKHATVE